MLQNRQSFKEPQKLPEKAPESRRKACETALSAKPERTSCLIITDCCVPEVDGMYLLHAAREHAPGLVVIRVTA